MDQIGKEAKLWFFIGDTIIYIENSNERLH